jgi:hypothetical protein
VLILVDSVGKYLTGIRDAEILSYRGETIGEFIHKIRYNIIKLNRYTHVIVHVGTNNVLNNKPGEILSLYRNLIHLIKQKYKNIIVGISSILPRPKDHSLSGTDIKNVNLGLAKICKDEKVLFIRSYKRFFYSNGIFKRDLFAIRDGWLHLNEPGLFQFQLALIHVISHW